MNFKRIWLAALLVVVMVFAPTVSWSQTTRVTKTDALLDLLRQSVAQQYQIPAQGVLVIWNDQSLETKLSQMGKNLSVEVSDQDLTGLVQKDTLVLKVMDGTRYKGRVPVRVKVDGWADTYQTTRLVKKGEALDLEKVNVKRVKLSALPAQMVKSPFLMEDYLAKQDIPANTILRLALLQERPLVEKEMTVRIVLINGNLKLLAEGEALDSGPRNAMVRVRITSFESKKIVRARVSGEGEVTLEIDEQGD